MKRYVFAGASSRALDMYAVNMVQKYSDCAALAGVYDINGTRAGILGKSCGGIPVYGDFDRMISDCKPDRVIVTSIDSTHHIYTVKALEAGCDVILEKPMAIDAAKLKEILDAEKRTGRRVSVTFNCRFIPYVARIKEMLLEGVIGEIYNIDFEWMLDTSHGADYFRRWHRYMKNSGGLLVHKATHHFDIINWWLDEDPELVFASGTRRFYGDCGKFRGNRCHKCRFSDSCRFYWDITAGDFSRRFYFEAEKEDGYIRDGCVFASDIDIYDTMSVNVKYSGGALLSYSLNAYSPYEGWKASINGSGGRIEAEIYQSGSKAAEPIQQIRLYNRNNEIITEEMIKDGGVHGGGDKRLLKMILEDSIPDPLGQLAGTRAGAMSVAIGAAANKSIKEGRALTIGELLDE